MFAADDEDGDFLSPTGGAKLASLFGMDQAVSLGNESFQYTAPKQPRKSSGNSGPPSQKPAPPTHPPSVLFATAAHAYRYVNGQHVKQGKLGAAVLGNHSTKEYRILLYVSQQKQVAAARLHPGFLLTLQAGNYCTFYDEQRQNWSLMFDSDKAASDFCRVVCLARVGGGLLEAVLVQDLLLGEGPAVEGGDSVEVAYTGWLLQDHSLGQMFDSNLNKDKLLRVKLGAGKVCKGWDEGMLGMRKGGKRLMVIPSALGYGSQGVCGRVPPDSTLVVEAEIRRVKFAKDGSSRGSAACSPAPSGEGPGVCCDASRPANHSALSDTPANPDATKAKLIRRMARMGQPLLPLITGPASSPSLPDSSDSELEADSSVSRVKNSSSAASPQPVRLSSVPPPSVPSAALLPIAMATANPQPVMAGTVHAFQPVNPTFMPQTVPYHGSSDVTSFLMTEARQHSTEIRLAVGKVTDKLDHLSSKIDDLQKQGSASLGLYNIPMEAAMIMHNIQRIVQENECLKKEVFEKSSRIEEQNRKICELINHNQRYMEQNNLMMEQRHDSLKSSSEQNQARILQAEQEKVRLTEELSSSTARVSELQLESSSRQQHATVLQNKLSAALLDAQQHSTRVTSLNAQLHELQETEERLQTRCKTEKQRRKELELKCHALEEELQDVTSEKEALERTLADRKRKWQAERQRGDEELEELRRSSQQEMEDLKSQLRQARTSSDHVSNQQLQAELEQEWKLKCDQSVAAARERHVRDVTELSEHRDTLQLRLTQCQDKCKVLQQSRESEEDLREELQLWRDKCSVLEELKQQRAPDTSGAVKRVMNGVFQSLRGQFDVKESYTGGAVMAVMLHTIKGVTLQLLTDEEEARPDAHLNGRGRKEEEEVEDSPSTGVEDRKLEIEREVEVKGEEPQTAQHDQTAAQEPTRSDITCDITCDITAHDEDQSVATLGPPRNPPPPPPHATSPTPRLFSSPEKVEEENGEERPTVQSPATPTDQEEEEPVRRKHTPTDEEEEEEPVRRKHTPTDEKEELVKRKHTLTEEEEELVKRKHTPTDEEEEEPVRRKHTPTDEEEEEPVKRRNTPTDEEEEEPVRRKHTPTDEEEELVKRKHTPTDEEEEPVRRKHTPTDEEEEELSLKGQPPPAPLFGDDSDDEDLGWLG